MQFKDWQGLNIGDKVALVAPGSRCGSKELKEGIKTLKSWGLVPQWPLKPFSNHPFCSNTDSKRLSFLKKAIYSEDTKAIFCVRGGYGSLRLVPELARLKPPKHYKPLIGYSDITSLHTLFGQSWGWPSIHGPLVCELGSPLVSKASQSKLKDLLFKSKKEFTSAKLKPLNPKAKKVKQQKGKIVGGNLTVIQSGIGTPAHLVGQSRWVVIEEIGERGYRVDRMLHHIDQAYGFRGVKGIIFGSILSGHESTGKDLTKQAIMEFAMANKYPCYSGLKVGHGLHNWPLLLNSSSLLEKKGSYHQLVQKI